jgi:hypothetical protein
MRTQKRETSAGGWFWLRLTIDCGCAGVSCARLQFLPVCAIIFLTALRLGASPRLALMDFTTDDNSYRSTQAAADFSALLQVKLMDLDGIEWVERSQLQAAEKELNLSAGGFVSSATALHAGKFVKADLLVVGQFITTPRHERSLHLEAIDLARADVLAEISLPMAGMIDQPLEISAQEVTVVEKSCRSLIQQALEHESRVRNQTALAPLFFANTSSSRRLDYFETELQSALAENAAHEGVRVLQFPRSTAAAGEAELVVAGLAEQDPVAWQKVGDIYVWGQYAEGKSDGLAFEQTPVTFTLNFWDGSRNVQTVTETVKVSEWPQLKASLLKQIFDAAQSLKKQPPSETARRAVARQLMFRAYDIQALFRPAALQLKSPLYQTEQGRQLWNYEVKLLATAHFFLPESYIIQRLWLERRWYYLNYSYDFRTTPGPSDLFWQTMEQLHSYADFDEKYGLIAPKEFETDLMPPGESFDFSRPDKLDDNLVQWWRVALQNVSETIQGKDGVGIPITRMAGFPLDAPPEVTRAWRDQLKDNYYGSLAAEEKTRPGKKMPLLNEDVEKGPQGVAIEDDATGWTNRQELVALDLLPPRLNPELQYVMFPENAKADGIVALKYSNGALWASTQTGGLTLDDPAWGYLTWPHANSALWRLAPGESAFEMLSGNGGPRSAVTSFCKQPDRLWMTLDQDGVSSLVPGSMQSASYGDKQGVLSRHMFASAVVGNHLYFGGGEPNNGKLNYVELSGLEWKSQDLGDGSGAQVKLLQPFGHSLLVNDRILDTSNGSWRSIRELANENVAQGNRGMRLPKFDILSAAADSNTLWLGTTIGLIAYNPDTKARQNWFSLAGGYLVDVRSGVPHTSGTPPSRLPGSVTALANDGDFLWVAATTRFDSSHAGNGYEGQWINGHFVLSSLPGGAGYASKIGSHWYENYELNYVLLLNKSTRKWVGYFPVTSRVTSLAVSNDKLWIGLEDTGYVQYGGHDSQNREVFTPSPVIAIQKPILLSVPPDQWVSDEVTKAELDSQIPGTIQSVKPELESQEQEEIQAIKDTAEMKKAYESGFARNAFLTQQFGKFLPVQLQKDANGEAVLQHIYFHKNMIEYKGMYYCSIKLTIPEWFDGNLKWVFTVAKTQSERDMPLQNIDMVVLRENGGYLDDLDAQSDILKNYPRLQQRLPYTHTLTILNWDMSQFEPGKTYAIWFGVHEQDYPDIAFAITVDSQQGTKEFGSLPLN